MKTSTASKQEAACESSERPRGSGSRLRASAQSVNRPKLLLVEDDEGVGRTLQKTLEKWVDVTWVRNYGEAVSTLSNQVFSALITDMRLEGPSGLDVLEKFRELQPRTPAMVLTAYLEEADSVRACEFGAQYVGKPISTEALYAFLAADSRLSGRESDVVRRLRLGHSTKVIAIDLGLAEASVRVLLHRAGLKLGVTSRQELGKPVRMRSYP